VLADRLDPPFPLWLGAAPAGGQVAAFAPTTAPRLEALLHTAAPVRKSARRLLVLTESLFSAWRGTSPELAVIPASAQNYGALLAVDEARPWGCSDPVGGGLAHGLAGGPA